MFRIKTLTSALALGLALATPSCAQGVQEAPSTVGATYVPESATKALAPGEKIENFFNKNVSQDYILQKLTDRVYFYQHQFYGTIFYVGDEGVLMIDALEGSADTLKAAVAEVTDLPITAILYSHYHADHIADAAKLLESLPDARVIATEATVHVMDETGSNLPRPTEVISPDVNSFAFEDLTVRVVPFAETAHAHDHAIYVLEGTGVVHVPDVINPDQPPFWSFAGADVKFYKTFLDDLEAAVGQALGKVPWGAGLEHPEELNAHTAYLSNWIAEIGKYATEVLRPKYGEYYGFEYATPKNAELVGMYMFSYR
ncbi:MBL fold metallo-hydrolase [uncultured Celeribacter sp.]|uniref:MBL fold metallo-hydrolase n=1 Tax=uncultured Celeribacter sp. TaxID=1303376 RepID=UPI002AA5E5AB|nr:MBL fold metallo-hydrolase [uncultured Celeribacter sp.]